MRRCLWGVLHYRRKAEGNYQPSVSLLSPEFFVISENLHRFLNPLTTTGFCFVSRQRSRLLDAAVSRPAPRMAVIGSFLSGFGTFKML